ncbi:MAG: ribonuclease R [Deltaproteobacteria bacterium]|nr:ribonuclease R [Deltaproteobacteria bacterium]
MDSVLTTTKQKILTFFSSRPRHRISLKDIEKALASSNVDSQETLAALKELTKEGVLVRLKKNQYALPRGQNILVGRVQGHPDGFGFLIPEQRGEEDVYLNRREMRRVMHGDRVTVRVEQRKRGGTDAHVLQVLERGQRKLVGTYGTQYGKQFIVPMDPRVGGPIPLTGSSEAMEEGQIIAAEIHRYGTSLSRPEAKFVEHLGNPDDPEVQANAIIFRYGLPNTFMPETLREAEKRASIPTSDILATRRDLRSLATVTIDGEQARDFDDSVSVEKKNHLYQLYVSIADVAHYVTPGSSLDQEAFERGTSVYFPDRAIPMLPESLSNGICSLNPGEERLTKTALITIDSVGEVVDSQLFSAVIRSRQRLTYTQVARILADKDPGERERCKDLVSQLELMEELARILLDNRTKRGNLDFDLPEAEIILDIQGMPENIIRAERNIAHRIIEEFMIAANEAVARHLTQRGHPLLYRIHEEPEEEALEALDPFLLSLGYRLPLKRGKPTSKDYQRLLDLCRGKAEERVLNRVLLRSMKQARYSPENLGHFGLASTCYTHFTSPIRRYPDLLVHRALDETMEGKRLSSTEKDDLLRNLEEWGKHTSERERIAMDAEREMVDLKKAQFMMNKMGEEFDGFVNDLAPFGFFVELEVYFVEGLVHLNSLTDDSYHYYESEHAIKGRRHGRTFRLGDIVRVKLTRINAFRGELTFELVSKD